MTTQNNIASWRRMNGSRGTHAAKAQRDTRIGEIRHWLADAPDLSAKAVAEKYEIAEQTARLYLHEAKGAK